MIKKYLDINVPAGNLDKGLLVLRIIAGGFMLTHGIPKLMQLLSGNMEFGDPIGIGAGASLVLTVLAEFVCALLILIGLGTRLAAIPLIITMLVAAFVVHASDPFGSKELSLIYLGMYMVLFLLGSGKYSVDGRKSNG